MAGVMAAPEGAGLEGLDGSARSRLQALLGKVWSLPGEHPLGALHGKPLGPYRLLVLLGPKSSVGSRYFQLLLANGKGRLADEPPALGLHNRGPYPAFNWVELTRFEARQAFGDAAADLYAEGLALPLFGMLSELVPPGGHLMVEYDSPSQKASERALTLGYPPVTSPIGYLMFQVGCRSFRDWYISEGGREGPRKLQGFMPWNEEIATEKAAALVRELQSFLSAAGAEPEWRPYAEANARQVLQALGSLRAGAA
jgi:hypothetical protein